MPKAIAAIFLLAATAACSVPRYTDIREVDIDGRTYGVAISQSYPGQYLAYDLRSRSPNPAHTARAIKAIEKRAGCPVVQGTVKAGLGGDVQAAVDCG